VDFRMQIGRNLAACRAAVGMTQEQLSLESGLTTTQISRIEKGRANPLAETLVRLAKALGVPVAALVAELP
jgi:transcriptional regulator with XRE-family HTH domain